MRYDIAIVGSGPAGLSAAINAKIRNKNIIVFGTESLSNKLIKAPSIDNYLGFYEISGEELREKFQDHLDKMEIEITYKKIILNRLYINILKQFNFDLKLICYNQENGYGIFLFRLSLCVS